jgi:hypothetical protein
LFIIEDGEILSADSAQGAVGAPFSYHILANNNPTWYSASGLPSGLTYNGRTGLISGTPTRSGTFSIDITARNFFTSIFATISLTIQEGTRGIASLPSITTIRTGDRLLLTWPKAPNEFILEESQTQLNAWTNASAKIVTLENDNVALIPTGGTVKFYRLRK